MLTTSVCQDAKRPNNTAISCPIANMDAPIAAMRRCRDHVHCSSDRRDFHHMATGMIHSPETRRQIKTWLLSNPHKNVRKPLQNTHMYAANKGFLTKPSFGNEDGAGFQRRSTHSMTFRDAEVA